MEMSRADVIVVIKSMPVVWEVFRLLFLCK